MSTITTATSSLVAGFTDRMLDENPLNEQSRKRWTMMIGAMMMRTWTMETIHTVAAAGEGEFYRVAHPILANQALHASDYARLFRIIQHASRTDQRVSLRLILNESELQ